MARLKEPLTGGVWTIKDPALLEPGQLSDARNCYYLPGAGALQKARGRQVFGTVSATAVDINGLRDIQFDNGDQYLYCLASGGNIYRATVGDTGTWALVTSYGGGTSLEAVQYQNRFVLFNGALPTSTASATAVNNNMVVYLSATAAGTPPSFRQHGMLPVVGQMPSATAGGGTFSQTTTGYYEYWCTEVAKLTADGRPFEMESTYQGDPVTVYVSATSVVPTLTLPAVRNSLITTHWRIYRSAAKEASSDVLFPAGYKIAEMAAVTAVSASAQVSVVDSLAGAGATASASALPNNYNSGNQLYTDMGADASALTAVGGTSASLAVPAGSGGKWQGFWDFRLNGTNGFVGNVCGIQVEFKAYISAGTGPVPIQVSLGSPRNPNNGDYGTPTGPWGGNDRSKATVYSKTAIVTATVAAGQTVTVGAATGSSPDNWATPDGKTFTSTDFMAGASGVMVVLYSYAQNTTVTFDYVKLYVSYGGTSPTTTVQFPQVVYVFGDTSAQVGKNGPPPTSDTGDIFQDQLVVNDVTSPRTIRYSYPGDIEAFPSTYYLDFQTRENDRVRCIKNVNGRLMIWLDGSTWRVNYLPSERDASFDRGKAIEAVSKTYGAVNNMCVATFSPIGLPEQAAWVSDQGIHVSDGFNFDTVTKTIDWTTIRPVDGSSYTPIALINDRDRHMLLYYFKNTAYDPERYMCLPLSYHHSHIQNGQLKVGGLIHMRNYDAANQVYGEVKSAWTAPRTDGSWSTYIGYGGSVAGGGTATAAGGGKVYIESSAATFPATDPNMSFKTRRIYANGLGGEWTVNELYGYAPVYSLTPDTNVTYTPLVTKTNDTGEAQGGGKLIKLSGQKLHKVNFRRVCEGLRVSAQVSASAYGADFLIFDMGDLGLEDSGR